MFRKRHVGLLCVPFLLWPQFVQSQPLAAALYAQGQYQAAIDAGQAAGDSGNLSIAAEAELAEASADDAVCLVCAKRAETLARRAIAADAKIPRAYVYLAWAIAYESRSAGLIASRRAHYGEDSKRAAETALTLAPMDAWSLAAMGGWHLEVIRAAGPFLAGLFYGARLETGIDDLKRAMTAAPKDPMVSLQYALSLSSVALAAHRDDIAAALEQAAKATPHDAHERTVVAKAAELLELLRAGDRVAYLKRVNLTLGVPVRGGNP